MRSPTFVVGTGRSGSTALSRILRMHPDVLSLNELWTSVGTGGLPGGVLSGARFWQVLATPNPIFESMLLSGVRLPEFLYDSDSGRFSPGRPGVPAILLMVLPHLTDRPDYLFDELAATVCSWPKRTAPEHYAELFGALCSRFGRHVVVERSGLSVWWIPALQRGFPGARFIHLHRDGPDCALSMSRHAGFRMLPLIREILELARVGSLDELTPDQLRRLPPDLTAVLSQRYDAAVLFERDIPPARFGALWSDLVVEGVGALEAVPEDMRMDLSYEAMLESSGSELSRVADFIGITPHREWLDRGRMLLDGSRRGSSLRLPPHELAELRRSCVPGQRALRRRSA